LKIASRKGSIISPLFCDVCDILKKADCGILTHAVYGIWTVVCSFSDLDAGMFAVSGQVQIIGWIFNTV